jgi:hypothetical protein
LLFGGASSYFAKQRGRDPFAWFLIGMLLGILGLLLLFLLPPLSKGALPEEVPQREEIEPSLVPQEREDSSYRLKDWYYLDDQRNQVGPNTFNQLRKAAGQGKIHPDTYVWTEGMDGWKIVEELPIVKEALL